MSTINELKMNDYRKLIEGKLGKSESITVYAKTNKLGNVEQGTFFCALVETNKLDKYMNNYNWDLRIGGGKPGFCFCWSGDKEIAEYRRLSKDGLEPFVHFRNFYGIKKTYFEISEEFRLYFNLYEDYKSLTSRTYYLIDDNGDEEEAAIIEENEIRIRLKLIKEYLAARKLSLLIYFEFMRFSDEDLDSLGLEKIDQTFKSEDTIYKHLIRTVNIGDKQTHSWILGKKVIHGAKDFKPDLFGVGKKQYEEFIIGTDDEGNDGLIYCCGLWTLRIDNNHPKYVMVYLGDLGHLEHKEQMYWKSFNVSYDGGISGVAWERNFEAKFTAPEQPDLFFKMKFELFQKEWAKKYGWSLFKPLSKDDFHNYKSLHIPLNNNRKEFDEQVLSLVKVIIDSLNEKKLSEGIEILKSNPKGIDKLEAFLQSKGIRLDEMIKFLRNLQTLRSSSVAHRKSKNKDDYLKVQDYFKFDELTLIEVFEDILIKTIWTLNTIEKYLL